MLDYRCRNRQYPYTFRQWSELHADWYRSPSGMSLSELSFQPSPKRQATSSYLEWDHEVVHDFAWPCILCPYSMSIGLPSEASQLTKINA